MASGGYSPAGVCGMLIAVASLVAEHRLQGAQASVAVACGLSAWSSWALENRLMGLVALQHVGSSQIRDRMHVSCIGRQILTTEPAGKALASFLSRLFAHVEANMPNGSSGLKATVGIVLPSR